MSFNGSGSYSLPAGNPVTANSTISSTVHNNTMSDIASALSNVICKDGQTTITANIPMSSYKLTGLAAGSAAGNSLRYEQLFTTGTVTMLGPLAVVDGTVTAPGLRFSSSSTTGIFSSSDNTVRFTCNDSTEGVFSSAGLQLTHALNLSASTSGQIQFPATQNASANANTLDDYEEGTWTPAISFGGGTTGITYTTQTGTYTKIGNRVLIDGIITLSAKGSSTGAALITGLPFTVAASTFSTASLRITALAAAIDAVPAALFTASATTMNLQKLGNGDTAISNLEDTNFSDTTQILFSGQFRV